ncbi:hypothetical protein [Microbacterium testaceum]|uniref:hypothetical protein n=1 Tax=Microbacterium testaceum TaxID=2033 RepID=UPI001D173976|nr:hypothetical protein [Microbacterium testaceum]MCC4247485.1 hypothetical protein [Microbacterium testaceum]
MTDLYRFEYGGAPFSVNIEPPSPTDTTTTDPPNVRVVEGPWKTWHLSVPDGSVPGLAGIRLVRSVAADGGEHPAGNLTSAESAGSPTMMMVAAPAPGGGAEIPGVGFVNGGEVYRISGGWGIVSRFYTDEEWTQLTATWEAWLRSQGGAA